MPTRAQIGKIWAAAREVGLDRGQVYDMVRQVSGQASMRELSVKEAARLIDRLVQLGASGPSKPSGRRKAKGEVQLITGPQRDHIERLRDELGEPWTRDPYFEGACERLLDRPRPRTASEGARVIEMLRHRIDHARRKGES